MGSSRNHVDIWGGGDFLNLFHKPYFVEMTTMGGGGSKINKIIATYFMDGSHE